jgi:hypothetical protein
MTGRPIDMLLTLLTPSFLPVLLLLLPVVPPPPSAAADAVCQGGCIKPAPALHQGEPASWWGVFAQ